MAQRSPDGAFPFLPQVAAANAGTDTNCENFEKQAPTTGGLSQTGPCPGFDLQRKSKASQAKIKGAAKPRAGASGILPGRMDTRGVRLTQLRRHGYELSTGTRHPVLHGLFT